MDGLITIACNQMFPYIHAFAAINIAISACALILMILAYFLTPRGEYLEYIEGNYENYGEEMGKQLEDLAANNYYNAENGNQYGMEME